MEHPPTQPRSLRCAIRFWICVPIIWSVPSLRQHSRVRLACWTERTRTIRDELSFGVQLQFRGSVGVRQLRRACRRLGQCGGAVRRHDSRETPHRRERGSLLGTMITRRAATSRAPTCSTVSITATIRVCPLSFGVVCKDEEFTDPKTDKLKRRSRVTKSEMTHEMLDGLRDRRVRYRGGETPRYQHWTRCL